MCKNADKPCPGCKKHKKSEAEWMFFTDEEREKFEAVSSLRKKAPFHART